MPTHSLSSSLLALLALALPALGTVNLREPDAPKRPTLTPSSQPPIGNAAPVTGTLPTTVDDLDDPITHKVRVGPDQYVVQTQGRVVKLVKINNKDVGLTRARVDGDSLRLLDSVGNTLATVELGARTNSLSGAGAGTSIGGHQNNASRTASSMRAMMGLSPEAPLARPGSASSTSPLNPDLSQLAGRAVMVGVQMMPVDPALVGHLGLTPGRGVMVAGVVPGLPADLAGLKPFDIILEIDACAVENANTLRDVLVSRKANPGDKLKLRVISAGQPKVIELTLVPLDLDRLATTQWKSIPADLLSPNENAAAAGLSPLDSSPFPLAGGAGAAANTGTGGAGGNESLATAIQRARDAGIARARGLAEVQARITRSGSNVAILTNAPEGQAQASGTGTRDASPGAI
ncbi:MAG: PDZ domain-containing protein, partial [Phycisphaerales bacterium]|nr:PDZ domain-containing protein [Phycisphaerales bacterium]